MERLTAQYPKSPEVRAVYVNMLLTRNQSAERQTLDTQLRQLRTMDPTSLTTLELTAKVADRRGQGQGARDMLRKLVPQDFSTLDGKTTSLVVKVAELLTELQDYEGAEAIYTRLANRQGASAEQKGVLAQYVGTYRDPAAGFEMLENLQNDLPPVQLVEAAIQIVAAHRETVGEGYDERVERWLSRSLREDPDSYHLSLKKAAFRELQGKYDETAAIYRETLARDDVAPNHRAMVLNNLSYMIGLGVVQGTKSNEAAELINEAVRLLGPVSDVLDTRAVIYMKRQDFKSAAEDLKLAVIDAPTASKYFHLALALDGLGQEAEAKAAWEQGVSLGLTRDSVSKLEQAEFDRAEAKIKGN
jgi:tetratricopeptide (TPR) repeat protein